MFSPTPNSRPAPSSWLHAVRNAVDLAVAFATLESCTTARELLPRRDSAAVPSACPRGLTDAPALHPHRSALRASPRSGRAGAVPARDIPCLAPLSGRSRRRSAHLSAR
jgi:hypothetical protein